MSSRQLAPLDLLRLALGADEEAALPDAQLLGHFIGYEDDASFQVLVRRHGRMVMGVCLRVTRNRQDAEDAFQAAFLVLARKAASLTSRELLASWLYGVAYNTALKAKAAAAKRRIRERHVSRMPERAAPEQEPSEGLLPFLDKELDRLPEKYRTAIVLCDLEGRTQKRAAQKLGCSEKAFASRLSRGRAMLAKRLARYGFGTSGATLATLVGESTARASVSMSIVRETAKAASLFAAGHGGPKVLSAQVTVLVEGVLKTMLLKKLKTLTVALGLLGVMVLGLTRAAHYGFAQQFGEAAQARTTDDSGQGKGASKSDRDKLQGTWVMVTQESGGKPAPKEGMRPQWWHFEPDKLIIYSIDLRVSQPEKTEYTYAVPPEANPRTIDLSQGRRLEGPRTRPPDDVKGIYKIEGDLFTLAVGPNGLPATLKTKEGDGVLVAVFKREGALKTDGEKIEKRGDAPDVARNISRQEVIQSLVGARALLKEAENKLQQAEQASRMGALAKEEVRNATLTVHEMRINVELLNLLELRVQWRDEIQDALMKNAVSKKEAERTRELVTKTQKQVEQFMRMRLR
jgi:RNA polymerase sigma-70 factor (ECF subfamily)